jgi:hypothetical protein
MHQPNCSNVEMFLTISALAETVLADSSRPLQMVSVLVVYVLVADDGLQGLLEGADRLRISQTAPRRQSFPL